MCVDLRKLEIKLPSRSTLKRGDFLYPVTPMLHTCLLWECGNSTWVMNESMYILICRLDHSHHSIILRNLYVNGSSIFVSCAFITISCFTSQSQGVRGMCREYRNIYKYVIWALIICVNLPRSTSFNCKWVPKSYPYYCSSPGVFLWKLSGEDGEVRIF